MSTTAGGQPGEGTFIPIPSLQRSDGDVTLIYLSGDGVLFDEPLEDDWYRVTALGGLTGVSSTHGIKKSYIPEDAASPLGCVSQYQYCNLAAAEGSRCGPLASFSDAVVGAAVVFNSTPEEMQGESPIGKEATRLHWIAMLDSYGPTDLASIIYQLSAKS